MRVTRLAHAGLLVESPTAGVLMDPLLLDPFENDTLEWWPPTRINADALAGRYHAVVVSHEHMDHFSVRSLDQLERSTLLLYPHGCTLIELAAAALGFGHRRAVHPGESVPVGDLRLTFTPSAVRFPEVGVLVDHGGRRFWNAVDTEIDDRAVLLSRRGIPRPDVMFAPFQPLVEESLGVDGLGCPFPLTTYQQLVHAVVRTGPRCVVPASCGYHYRLAPWFDTRAFPVTEQDFLADLASIHPLIAGRQVPHGASIDIAELTVSADSGRLCEATGAPDEDRVLRWTPDRGVDPLVDDDPHHHGTDHLRRAVVGSLQHLQAHVAQRRDEWRHRLAEAGVLWELEVVYPDGSREAQGLDLTRSAPRWQSQWDRSPKIRTAITASTLVGLLTGETSTYRALHTRRVVLRLYRADARGVSSAGNLNDEPVARVLFPGADRRYVTGELRRLGIPA